MNDEFSPEEIKILDKVEALMRLAAKNTSEAESASASTKAMELLTAYNLSVDDVGKGGKASDARREQQKIKGGMYTYQRDLWSIISKLNFCLYWAIEHHFPRTIRRRNIYTGLMQDKVVDGKEFRHTVVGKRMNVKATMMMAQYLETTIERLVKERYPLNSQRFMSDAVAYREGMADTLYNRLSDKRAEMVRDEKRRAAEEAARRGISTSNALTIGSLAQREEDANMDFLHGEGWSAKQRAERAERAAKLKAAEEEYTRWAAANPEEAAKQEKARRKSARRYSGGQGSRGGMSGAEKHQYKSSYWQGREKGAEIGLDPQTSAAKQAPRLT